MCYGSRSIVCVGPDIMKLPAVLYFKKGDKKHGISGKRKHTSKHAAKRKVIEKRAEGDRRDVVFLNKPYDYTPTKQSPTTSYNLFDYKSNYRNWLFLYPDQHPVNMRYVDQGKAKAADPNQQNAGQQQAGTTQDSAGVPAGAAAPTAAPAAPAAAQPAAAVAQPAAAATTQPAAAAPAAPAAAQPAAASAAAQPAAPAAAAPAAPVVAQPASPAVAAPAAPLSPAAAAPAAAAASAAAFAPAVPQVGQAATPDQQSAAPVAAQQPVAAQPAAAAAPVTAPAAANQTIELINQTVSLVTNETQQQVDAVNFEPTVANTTQTNETFMVGAFQTTPQGLSAENNTSDQTVATGIKLMRSL